MSGPRPFDGRGCKVEIIILLPTGQIGEQEEIRAVLFKHCRRLSVRTTYSRYHFFLCRTVVLTQTIDNSSVQQQISGTVRVLISPHIPAANRLTFIQQRSVKFIFTCYSATGSITDMGIFIVHIVCMHIPHILAGRRAFHDFHTLAYTIRAKNSA